MVANEVQQLLSRLREGISQDIAIRISCDNLETVYVRLDEGDGIRVDDDHRTFQSLTESNGSTYVQVEKLDLDLVRKVCAELQVELVDAPPEGYPRIECRVEPEQLIAGAVDRVANTIDRVFELARKQAPGKT
jgi:hypothetical protein